MTDFKELQTGPFPIGEKNVAYQDVFTGQSYLAMLAQAPDDSLHVGNISFEPACRNYWHKHVNGYQILLVTKGEGIYQEDGSAPRLLKEGDVVVTAEGVKHWHGATKDSYFTYIAITTGQAEFLEAVSEEDYEAAHVALDKK